MIRGLPASIALHAVVIGAGYLAWPYVGTSVVEDEFVIVPVELVDVGEMTNVAPVVEPPEEIEPEPEEEPEPTPPEPEESEAPEEIEPDTRDLPEDDVSTASQATPAEEEPEDVMPDLEAEPEEEPEPEKKEPEQPKPEPKAPNPVQKRNPLDDFLSDAESTFESERQTKRETQPPKLPERQLLNNTPPAQDPRKGAGERTANTVRIEQLLYNQIYPCWDGVADQPDPERLNVSMRAELDAEGNLIDIELVRPSRAPIGDRSMSLAVERALRAVRKCQPYRLPRDDYEIWKIANINLGPAFIAD
ncbi:hypothetical protein [Henriciella mobilis]|uniref:Energy transducer TonB n=1 Tax=Henriciella mobilis TaxID=2305467 RepID=A0A399RIJ5_9PROT|nr:hypothetical protein [Henriciella mobilis]RIJ30234.1 hypothetical protein D1223_06190 [Henriciella mobilis]